MVALRGKILVIRGGAIGDFILTFPVFAALRAQFPATHLEVLGYPHIAQLARAGGLVDAVQAIESRSLAGFFARDCVLPDDWREYFAGFHLVLSYLYDPDRIFQDNVRRCGSAQFIAGPHRPAETESRAASEILLQPLEHLAIFQPVAIPRLQLPADADTANVPATPGSWLAVHPGSGSERKNWPEAKWMELFDALVTRTPVNFLLIGGEAEKSRLERLRAALPGERLWLADRLPLVQVAGLLRGCSGFAGHDSGISHLAAALGLPCVLLWGETSEAIWAPRNPRVQLVRGGAKLAELPVAEVLPPVRAMLGL